MFFPQDTLIAPKPRLRNFDPQHCLFGLFYLKKRKKVQILGRKMRETTIDQCTRVNNLSFGYFLESISKMSRKYI